VSRLHHIAKELFGGVVGGNARGDGDAGPIPRSQQTASQLGKDSIGIDIARGCQGKAPAAPLNDTQGLGIVQGLRVLLPQGRAGDLERTSSSL